MSQASSSITFTEAQLRDWALGRITKKRRAHVRGVVDTATSLAQMYAPERVRLARFAGWMHDAAKHYSDDDLLIAAERFGYVPTDSERMIPMLLHGVVGYFEAAAHFNFTSAALKQACAYHTTGHPDMTTLDKIVFLADICEPQRDFPGVDAVRRASQMSLDRAVLLAVDCTLEHLLQKRYLIDPRAVALRNVLLQAGVKHP